MSWSRSFDVPIKLPDGKALETLDDARKYLLKLPKSKHRDPHVAAATEAVLMAANGTGPVMHANLGLGLVVYGPKPPPEPRPATTRWGKRKLARDR